MGAWMWPFFRIGAMLIAVPIFGASYIPVRVRLGLALTLCMAIAPLVQTPPQISPFSPDGVLITVQQVLIGVTMGLALRMIFVVFELAGQIIAQHMALHFASMVDPNSGVQVPMISQLYIVMGTLVLLSLNGHLVFIQIMVESFQVLPVGTDGLGSDGIWHFVQQMEWVFSAAMLFAIPAVAALLVVNLSFGVMTRAAPQLNIFAIGFPITLMLGFSIILFTLPNIFDQFEPLFADAINFTRRLIAGDL